MLGAWVGDLHQEGKGVSYCDSSAEVVEGFVAVLGSEGGSGRGEGRYCEIGVVDEEDFCCEGSEVGVEGQGYIRY